MPDYFRGDERSGITAPDLSKEVEYCDHIVKARGKRSQYTSVSKEPGKIRDFGDQLYRLKRPKVDDDGHTVVEHETLIDALQDLARGQDKGTRQKAIQALRYAKKRLEGLVQWKFNLQGVARKDLISWAQGKVQPYFEKE